NGGLEAARIEESDGRASVEKFRAMRTEMSIASSAGQSAAQASKAVLWADFKTLADAGKAASTTPEKEWPAGPTKPPPPAPQLALLQDIPLEMQKRLEAPVPIDGMDAALNKQRMKFAAEKNEIAGRTVQKLPDATSSVDSAGGLIGKVSAKSDSNFP